VSQEKGKLNALHRVMVSSTWTEASTKKLKNLICPTEGCISAAQPCSRLPVWREIQGRIKPINASPQAHCCCHSIFLLATIWGLWGSAPA